MEKRKREIEERRRMVDAKRRKVKSIEDMLTTDGQPSETLPISKANETELHAPSFTADARSISVDPFAALEAQTHIDKKGKRKATNNSRDDADNFLAQLGRDLLSNK